MSPIADLLCTGSAKSPSLLPQFVGECRRFGGRSVFEAVPPNQVTGRRRWTQRSKVLQAHSTALLHCTPNPCSAGTRPKARAARTAADAPQSLGPHRTPFQITWHNVCKWSAHRYSQPNGGAANIRKHRPANCSSLLWHPPCPILREHRPCLSNRRQCFRSCPLGARAKNARVRATGGVVSVKVWGCSAAHTGVGAQWVQVDGLVIDRRFDAPCTGRVASGFEKLCRFEFRSMSATRCGFPASFDWAFGILLPRGGIVSSGLLP